MTYLDLINGVLRRLREDTVITANETDYSQLVGESSMTQKQVISAQMECATHNCNFINQWEQLITRNGAKQNAVLEQV